MILNRLQIVRDIRLPLEKKNVYTRLGYKKGKTELSPKMIHLIDEAFEKAGRVMTPAGAYIIRQIENREETIQFSNSDVTVTAASVKELLKKSFAVLFMAVTIGPGLENQIALSSEEKQFEKTLILDAIGSEGAEAAADALNDHLLVLARQSKMTLTRRFSPGYGDLSLQFQAQLYKELSLASLGISIDDKFFLQPKKTVTALLGVER